MTPPVVIKPQEPHTATVLFLHGLGDSGMGWASTIAERVPPYCKVICPTAPVNPVTLNGGYPMTSWFDLLTLAVDGKEDETGIKKAGEAIHAMIKEEEDAGLDSGRILIGGFSQGGGLAVHSGLRYPKPLAGILALSCWLPIHKEYPAAVVPANQTIPILQCHGDQDVIVPYPWGTKSSDMIKAFNPTADFKAFKGMGHSSCEQELVDARAFIARCLPPV